MQSCAPEVVGAEHRLKKQRKPRLLVTVVDWQGNLKGANKTLFVKISY